MVHVVKSSLGTGVLAIPEGFKNAGYIIGIFGTIIVGIMCTHCTYIMVKCSQELTTILNRSYLSYTETVEQALLQSSNKKFSRFAYVARNVAEGILFFTYYGTNTVYVILVAATLQQLLEYHLTLVLNIRYYILITALPFLIVGIIRSMKYLVPFSAVSNVFLLTGLFLTFYYMLEKSEGDDQIIKHKFAPVKKLPLFVSTAMFGMEGIGTVLPIYYSMKNRSSFLGMSGVLVISMTFVIFMFCLVGFFGYNKYGDTTLANVVLNIRQNALSEVIKLLISLSMLFSYGLQLTASMDVVWYKILPFIKTDNESKCYYNLRALLVFGTVLLAILVPKLGPVISLIGAVGFSMCGFFFPAIVETVMSWDGRLGKYKWILWKNISFMAIALFAICCGSTASVAAMIKHY